MDIDTKVKLARLHDELVEKFNCEEMTLKEASEVLEEIAALEVILICISPPEIDEEEWPGLNS